MTGVHRDTETVVVVPLDYLPTVSSKSLGIRATTLKRLLVQPMLEGKVK
jgi:hypothetical protein